MKHPETSLSAWLLRVDAESAFAALADAQHNAAVFAVDSDRNVVFWSRGAEKLLGFTADEVVGSHCLKSNRCERCLGGCGIAEYGTVRDVPLVLFAADGTPVRLRKSGRAFVDADGRFLGGVEVLTPENPDLAARAPLAANNEIVTFHGLASGDPSMHLVFDTCRNVAETDSNVLVRGESGSGKELLARAVHAESARAGGPFVAVNCAALTASLLESELFGHVKGAFTGAVRDRDGIFRQADGGTLFLDEVAELPLDLQAKLLRVLEEHAVTPVGGTRQVPVDVRLVAATHRSLRQRVRSGRFREDLMFRLRVVPIFIPPLRDRRTDISVLLWRFIAERNVLGPRIVESISPDAMRALLDHDWPGNVRELRNVIAYAFAVGRSLEIQRHELPPELREGAVPVGAEPTRPVDERTRIRSAMEASGGHVGRAAEILGMSRPTLWRKRKKYGM